MALALALLLAGCTALEPSTIPPGFVDLAELFEAEGIPLQVDLRYRGNDNFVGSPIDGYEANRLLISAEAGASLAQVARALEPAGLGLRVFDAYRPQQAVDHFVRWARDLEDRAMKARYYPNVDKAKLFSDGYIAARSGHSRGSTVDLTLVDLDSGEALDMGSDWDFFDPISWPESREVTEQQYQNRQRLRAAMLAAGFRPLAEEWWHFTLDNEPYPDRYFDYPIR